TIPLLTTLISACTLCQLVAAPDLGAINDQQIKKRFEQEMGKLEAEESTPKPETILEQLKERKHHTLELPDVMGIPRPMPGAALGPDIYDKRKSSVLCFGNIYKCDNCNNWHGNLAGGFVITADGVAVTNYHVMENAKAGAFGAMTQDGKVYAVEEVLAASKRDDLAIVKLAGEDFSPAPIAEKARVGSRIIAISHPEGRFYTVSEGIVSRYYKRSTRNGEGPARLSITADFAKGSSGSPVFDAHGSVVGVVAATDSIYYNRDKEGNESNLQMVIKSCVPSSAILELISKQNADGEVSEAGEGA
ncbi:MAG: trypsin-like peptidase domain-containing protein, partial [Verrucomicrobiales bacterium]